jgi:hypothetical protein
MSETGSQWRKELVKQAAGIYQLNPHVDAVILGGSTARNHADKFSDIEIGVFWHQLKLTRPICRHASRRQFSTPQPFSARTEFPRPLQRHAPRTRAVGTPFVNCELSDLTLLAELYLSVIRHYPLGEYNEKSFNPIPMDNHLNY